MTDVEITESANAIAQAGCPDYKHHAGATLTLMTKRAKAGQLEAMCSTLIAHAALYPRDHRELLNQVPGNILNQYIYLHRQRSVPAVERWREQSPDWAETLKSATSDPVRFAAVARAMADDVGRLELG